MVFNSLSFFIFFAAVLVLYNLPMAWRARKTVLLVASYLFYASWNPPFVLLLWISTLTDFIAARFMARSQSKQRRRILLGLSLCVNLGILFFFKYAEFAVQSFIELAALAGIIFQPVDLGIFLPVGISFYTFQTMSYTLDVYLGRGKPTSDLLDYALYVTFFPQLVAGPIVRAPVLLAQFAKARRATLQQFTWGLSLLTVGLFEKMVIADSLLSRLSDRVFDAKVVPNMADAWLGALAFSGQIFCDFAGYSSAAIGVALCMGFSLPKNFRLPYASIGFRDFWQRWHISLSTWLRDYLYIPMGGNRAGGAKTAVNLMATMLLGGLWHGAAWTFVIWGGLHGLFLMAERGLTALCGGWRVWTRWPMRLVLGLATFGMVTLAWVFFRSQSASGALAMAGSMLGVGGHARPMLSTFETYLVLGVMSGLVGLHWLLRNTSLEQAAQRLPWWLRGVVLGLMLFFIATMGEVNRAFIYFQF